MAKRKDPLDLAPHSIDAEEAVLGSILMNPECIYALMAIPLTDDDFFILRHGWIYRVCCELATANSAIDTRTVAEKLRMRDQLEDVGGESYLMYLPNTMPTALHAEVYGRIVHAEAVRRRVLGAAGEIARICHDYEIDIEEVISKAQAEVFALSKYDSKKLVSFEQALSDKWEAMEKSRNGEEAELVCNYYWKRINRILKGPRKGQLIVIAGRPGEGKSVALLQNTVHMAKHGLWGLFVSIEMPEREVIGRVIAQELGISTDDQDELSDEQWEHFVKWAAERAPAMNTIWFDTSSSITVTTIASRARDLARKGQLDFIVIDYLQRVTPTQRRMHRTEEIGDITRALKSLALELDVPIFIGAQLNRETVKAGQRPELHHLAESGRIEEDADVVWFIYNPGEVDRAGNPSAKRLFVVAKYRQGAKSSLLGDAPAAFIGEKVKFENLRLD